MAEQNIHALLPYAVNFSIVIIFLVYVARQPAKKFLYQRHERMKDSFEAAARAHQTAKDRSAAARGALQSVAAKESEIISTERKFAEQEKKEILEKSNIEAKRVLSEAERLVSVEQDESADRVKSVFLDLVVRGTEDSLRKSLKKDDHSAIVKRAQNSIEVGV